MSLSDIVYNIRHAVYAKKVREAIASAIEEISNKEDKNLEIYNNMVIGAGESNAEIVDARLDNNTGVRYEKVGKRLDKISSQMDEKAKLLNARMDTFTSLTEGSTTGDAELKDIRVGIDGTTYENAGNAVREQFCKLKNDLEYQEKNIFENFYTKTTNKIMVKGISTNGKLNCDFYGNDKISIKGTANNDYVSIFIKPEILEIGNYYISFSSRLCSTILGVGVKYNDDTKDDFCYFTNQSFSIIKVSKEKTVTAIILYVPNNSTIDYNGNVYLVSIEDYEKNKNLDYKPKYEPKLPNLKNKKWVAIGDSITFGYTSDTENNNGNYRYEWGKTVANYFEMDYVNLGVSGSTTAGFMRDEVINNIPVDVNVITVMGGTNDFGQSVNPDDVSGYEYNSGTYPGSIRRLAKYLVEHFPNATIIFSNCIGGGYKQEETVENKTLPDKNDIGKTREDYARICLNTCHEIGIECLDAWGDCGISILNRIHNISDSVHPTIGGYKKIEDFYIREFNRIFNY